MAGFNFYNRFSFLDKASVILVGVVLLCLLPLPYGFYTVVRFGTAVIACCWAYKFYEENKMPFAIIAGAIAILFQPLISIPLDRLTWIIIDILLSILIIILLYSRNYKSICK